MRPFFARAAAAALLALSVAAPAAAATLFDGTGLATSSVNRTYQQGLLANFRLPSAIHLTGFSQIVDLSEDSLVRFVVFEQIYDVTDGPSLFWASDPIAVADTGGAQEVFSPTLSLALEKGNGWGIGLIVDRAARYHYATTAGGVVTQNGISNADNSNVHHFELLNLASSGTVEGSVSLFGEFAAVPAPAAAPLALSGLAALGFAARRRRSEG